ncbi:atrial natriuretic peptide receptor 1-like [Paramacrobiotus metropolitanus]|uniref:atrial natriuretic peptide receptor 1-like n=1 Tax=Paramacrobiotus metropolitanus TaxID=2943436 RepID=UPI002445D629|nr:atrial natriuretic peptide receptor 1-like [Paramacrobiotus metropolitanus]
MRFPKFYQILCTWIFVFGVMIIGGEDKPNTKPTVIFLVIVPYDAKIVMAAVNLALQESQEKYSNMNIILHSIVNWSVTPCNYFEDLAPSIFAEYYAKNLEKASFTVFIPTGCTGAMVLESDFARELNIPVITSAGRGSLLQNKVRFPTLVRVLPVQIEAFSRCTRELFAVYKWRTITIICDIHYVPASLKEMCAETAKDLIYGDPEMYTPRATYLLSLDLSLPEQRVQALEYARARSRVIVLMVEIKFLLDMLKTAVNLGMMGKDYVYVTNIVYSSLWNTEHFLSEAAQNSLDVILQSLFIISLSPLPTDNQRLNNFTSYIRSQSNSSDITEESVLTAVCTHTAFAAAAEMVNETISLGYNLSDGIELTRSMYRRNFSSVMGTPFIIDENGDRDAAYSVFGVSAQTKSFQELWTFDSYDSELIASSRFKWIRHANPPSDRPPCGFVGDDAECLRKNALLTELLPSILIPCAIIYVAAFVIYRVHQRRKLRKEYSSWIILPEEITPASTISDKHRHLRQTITRLMHMTEQSGRGNNGLVRFHDQLVWCKKLKIQRKLLVDDELLEITYHRKKMRHDNIAIFFGVCIGTSDVRIISEFAPEHSFQDLLRKDTFQSLLKDIKLFLINGITAGMLYIHHSSIRVHGRLTASNCLIDRRLTVRLSDFGLRKIREQVSEMASVLPHQTEARKLYISPELLRGESAEPETVKGDVYSFAIVMHQVLFTCEPFWINFEGRNGAKLLAKIKEIISLIKKTPVTSDAHHRPDIQPVEPEEMPFIKLLPECWAEDPRERPDFKAIRRYLSERMPNFKQDGSLLEDVMDKLEYFTRELENSVKLKTATLDEEKKATDKLLAEILPKPVVERLRLGLSVPPEDFDQVTVGFTAVADFVTIVARIEPLMVVNFLHHMFRILDEVLSSYDVYKVETIGDSYMIASGIPVRNGKRHIREVSETSVHLMQRTEQPMRLRDMSCRLQLKVGLNTGPCAASVVGTRMLRYCLFGDTINTASRMTSFGCARKIHVSKDFMDAAQQFFPKAFQFVPRGTILIKGKGNLSTYWLVSTAKDESNVE